MIVDVDVVLFPKQIEWRLDQMDEDAFIGACPIQGWAESDDPLDIGFIPGEMRKEYSFSDFPRTIRK